MSHQRFLSWSAVLTVLKAWSMVQACVRVLQKVAMQYGLRFPLRR
jgi:hypothetical protein